ncbi:MAG: HPr(Ser) kinase/phosphatase [Oscillospiraceae bacterium]|nr:HPr(Ser) kinase/phosphatase [Oscillospiraceae bacterium]
MASEYSVSLKKLIKDHSFEVIYTPKDPSELYITSREVNRPGLVFVGYGDYFDSSRVQFVGLKEIEYLKSLSADEYAVAVERLMVRCPALIVITRSLGYPDGFLEYAQKYKVPVVRSATPTSECMSEIISYLSVELAERITRHGVMVEVYGEGVLILGGSGVGKSETAVELIKRGHRLIADDAVEIRKVSPSTLLGTAPDNIRHFIEIRGVGVINARRIFGMGAVKTIERIDMVIQLEVWDKDKGYDRLGLDDDYVEILGNRVPVTVVPVKPGRNLSIIIEVAAMNNRQKKMGYNAARELLHNLGMDDEILPQAHELELWHE